MPTSVYRMFAWSIENQVPMFCTYSSFPREFCPIILGLNKDGDEAALVWQTSGITSDGRLRKPEWKCFLLKKVVDPQLWTGEWQTGSGHRRTQGCVKEVDYDSNQASPYQPRRRLGDLKGAPLN